MRASYGFNVLYSALLDFRQFARGVGLCGRSTQPRPVRSNRRRLRCMLLADLFSFHFLGKRRSQKNRGEGE